MNSEIRRRYFDAFPRYLAPEVDSALTIVPPHFHPPSPDNIGPVRFRGEELSIPHRIYVAIDPGERAVASLGEIQRTIIGCLFTQHHNGFVRERFARQIVHCKEPWVPPFVLQLVGEYVIEITDVIADNLNALRNDRYVKFAAENPQFIALTKRRIISYWACYCRQQRFKDYPGFRVFDALELWKKRDARRLLASR
jgi:hypothetical protein